jgi:hypothetical protein
MVASKGHPGQVSSPRRWKSSAVAGAIALVLLGVSALGIAVSLASRASVWVKNDSSESVAFFVTDLSDGPGGYYVVPAHTTAHAGSDGIGLTSRAVRVNVLRWREVVAGEPCTPTDYDDTIYDVPAGVSVELHIASDGQPSVTLAPEPSNLPQLEALSEPTCEPER